MVSVQIVVHEKEEVTSIVVGVLDTIGTEFLIVTGAVKIGHLQQITLLWTARIHRKVLES